MKYAIFDVDGNPLSFYDSIINKTIPNNAEYISDADYDLYNQHNKYLKGSEGKPIKKIIKTTPESALKKYKNIYETNIYGRPLNKDDTELDTLKLKKIKELKEKFRSFLSWNIGDLGNNTTDILKILVMESCINNGHITDENIITRYNVLCERLLLNYGGAESIMDTLEENENYFQNYFFNNYYNIKNKILKAETTEEIYNINIDL